MIVLIPKRPRIKTSCKLEIPDNKLKKTSGIAAIKSNLIKMGFSIHETGKMSFFEQIYLFNNAKVIVGAHGAAFTNLVFCKPKTKIIEIIPKSHPNTVNKKISKVKNLNYYRFITKDLKENEKTTGDIVVNINALNKKLK